MNQFTIRTTPMPSEMQLLLEQYPREVWESHPGFKEKTQHWLGAHQMFRRLSDLVKSDAEEFLDKKLDEERYQSRLAYYGNALVGNLHGHHGWEDYSYFPELEAADARFAHGLEILEQDHRELDIVLDTFTDSAEQSIKHFQAGQETSMREVGNVYQASQTISAFLERHLSDEEELAVPIILHHRLRG